MFQRRKKRQRHLYTNRLRRLFPVLIVLWSITGVLTTQTEIQFTTDAVSDIAYGEYHYLDMEPDSLSGSRCSDFSKGDAADIYFQMVHRRADGIASDPPTPSTGDHRRRLERPPTFLSASF